MTCSGCINPVVKCGCLLGLSFMGLRPLWQIAVIHIYFGPQWRSWWRHCVTIRKVAGSISNEVNPSGRAMALGSTQPLSETSTRGITLGLKAAVA